MARVEINCFISLFLLCASMILIYGTITSMYFYQKYPNATHTIDLSSLQYFKVLFPNKSQDLVIRCHKEKLGKKIYIQRRGRLGNVLFEFAAAYGMSCVSGHTLIVDPRINHFLQESFRIPNGTYVVGYPPKEVKTLKQDSAYSYDEKFFNLLLEDINVYGYFVSWKYFANIQDQIRSFYKLANVQKVGSERFLQSLQLRNKTYISVHIRRTDMLSSNSKHKLHVRIPPLNYTLKAMDYFHNKFPNAWFIVVSDDIQWCKIHLGNRKDVSFSEGHNKTLDLAIMAACNHSIITHGTFGWWGAWLKGSGDVVYFDMNFSLQRKLELLKQNFFPSHWIGMH